MIYTGLVWSHIAQTIPGWFWAGNAHAGGLSAWITAFANDLSGL